MNYGTLLTYDREGSVMSDDSWLTSTGWLEKGIVVLIGVFSALGLRELLPKVWDTHVTKNRRKIEDKHLSTVTDNSLLDAATEVNKDYIALFKEVTVELRSTVDELRSMRRRYDQLEGRCERMIRKLLVIIKRSEIEVDYDKLEQEAEFIFKQGETNDSR